MKRFILITAVLVAAIVTMAALKTSSSVSLVCAAGSCTQTIDYDEYNMVHRLNLDWTANGSGVVTATVPNIQGIVLRVVTNPDDGATSPTASYDITITDVDGLDILKTLGGNRSQSASEEVTPFTTDATNYIPLTALGVHTLNIANAGDAKGGMIRLYLKR